MAKDLLVAFQLRKCPSISTRSKTLCSRTSSNIQSMPIIRDREAPQVLQDSLLSTNKVAHHQIATAMVRKMIMMSLSHLPSMTMVKMKKVMPVQCQNMNTAIKCNDTSICSHQTRTINNNSSTIPEILNRMSTTEMHSTKTHTMVRSNSTKTIKCKVWCLLNSSRKANRILDTTTMMKE